MATVLEYQVNSVILPKSYELTRDYYDPRSHVKGVATLDETDYQQHDVDTIFYDVFIDPSGESICALGPPLVNLKPVLMPLKAYVSLNDENKHYKLKHKLEKRDRVYFHKFALPFKASNADKLKLKLSFANGWKVSLDLQRYTLPHVFLQFTTIQKNNPIEWVIDWANYLSKMGAERIVLYDNNSDYYSELAEQLQACAEGLEIVLVNWPFKYGPARSGYNQFCQAGQNNHAHQCLGLAEWCGFFDIDEYLVLPGQESLVQKLKSTPSWRALYRIDNYLVPYVVEQTIEGLQSVRDFPFRNAHLRGKAHKYLARVSGLKEAKTHNGRVKWGYVRGKTSAKNMVFFHYMGLSTNWKLYDDRLKMAQFDSRLHEKDLSVIEKINK